MKRVASHISSKRGSMLMFTLIVFMVILTLGMTMITSMLYSQGENNMQMSKQKAYYAALSAVNSIKAYFLNPRLDTTISSPHELVGGKYTYNLKDQGIDEDVTVTVEIIDSGTTPTDSSKKYIDIKATANCNDEISVLTARLTEQEQRGASGGLFGDKVILGCGVLHKNQMQPLIVDGNIFINDEIDNLNQGQVLHGVHFLNTDEGTPNNLYIKSMKNSISMNSNIANNVYIQSSKDINLDKNELNNLFIQSIGASEWARANFSGNKISQQMQLFADNRFPTLYDNEIGARVIVDVTRDNLTSGTMTNTMASNVYITGAKQINANYLTGNSNKPVETLYTNAKISGEIYPWYNVKNIKEVSEAELAVIDAEEQKIGNVISGMEAINQILLEKPEWPRPEGNSKFVKIEKGFGNYPQDKPGSFYEEYYNAEDKIRLVFSDIKHYFKIKTEGYYYNNETDTYIIPNEYADDQIFFILQNAISVDFYTFSHDKFDALYVYSPTATCQFFNDFKYFNGSIIANQINIEGKGESITFRAPENVDGMEIPGGTESAGGTGSTGSLGGTTYTYDFEEYIENDKEQS